MVFVWRYKKKKYHVCLILHSKMSKVVLWSPSATQYIIEIQMEVFINKSECLVNYNGRLYSWPLSTNDI